MRKLLFFIATVGLMACGNIGANQHINYTNKAVFIRYTVYNHEIEYEFLDLVRKKYVEMRSDLMYPIAVNDTVLLSYNRNFRVEIAKDTADYYFKLVTVKKI